MAEDQGVNGDIWNDEASRLIAKLNWIPIGDSNVDVPNSEGGKNGIDRMYKYLDANLASQGVFLEAKRYKTSSFQPDNIGEWVTTLSKKITKNRNSEKFYDTYEEFNESQLRNGLIVIWFSDTENYAAYKRKFREALINTKIPAGRKQDNMNRVYVVDNYDVLRLASIVVTIDDFNKKHATEVFFYYPFWERLNNVTNKSKTLTLDYMASKFILSQAIVGGIDHNIVFYFGGLSLQAFKRLHSALQQFNFIEQHKPLTIFIYLEDDEFRKIKPDVIRLFEKITFDIKHMTKFDGLPSFMKNPE